MFDVARQPLNDPLDLILVGHSASGQHIAQGAIESLR
jgi:hypothetical protein